METEVRLAAYNELRRVNELQGRCAKKGLPPH